ncbi:MAG: hypothetical protein ACOY3E_04010 [Pseudomonadota bacterium]
MASLDRSVALRRLGITEWLPRHDDAAVVSVQAFPEAPAEIAELPATSPAPARAGNENAAASVSAVAAPLLTAVPVAPLARSTTAPPVTDEPAKAPVPMVPATANGAPAAAASLRGRLLRTAAQAPLLVLAMAEKSPRDTLLNVDTAAGTLLQAMLAELGVPSAIALLGVGGGEPIAVPDTVLVLGERSARLLLGNEVAMPLRGRVHLFGRSRVVVTYHPDELRQNGSLKRLAWEDLRLLKALLAAPVSGQP